MVIGTTFPISVMNSVVRLASARVTHPLTMSKISGSSSAMRLATSSGKTVLRCNAWIGGSAVASACAPASP